MNTDELIAMAVAAIAEEAKTDAKEIKIVSVREINSSNSEEDN